LYPYLIQNAEAFVKIIINPKKPGQWNPCPNKGTFSVLHQMQSLQSLKGCYSLAMGFYPKKGKAHDQKNQKGS